jgi:amidase
VPAGSTQGLPLGLTIMGRAFDENRLIALASVIEQKMNARTAPQFRPTLESR